MTTDHFMAQGSEHTICQDYVLSGVGRHSEGTAMAWAVVCDGCSASPDSDWGARLLAKGAERMLREMPLPGADAGAWWASVATGAFVGARENACRLGLPPLCLDATLLVACVANGTIQIGLWGDGVFACRQRATDAWEITEITFAAGYPDYLSYRFDADRRQRWESVAGNEKRLAVWREEAVSPTAAPVVPRALPVSDYDCVALFSDGVGSLRTASGGERDGGMVGAVRELLAFKNTSGAFLRRRWQRVAKEMRRAGGWHYDDLSAAVLYLPEET